MTHPDASFEKVGRSEKPLYGPEKLLVCGFSREAQKKFSEVQKMAGVADVDTVWVDESLAEQRLSDLTALAADTGLGVSSGLPRAVIVCGIAESRLRSLMTVAKKSGMKKALWAVLTPTSETWTLSRLLTELAAERRAMQK